MTKKNFVLSKESRNNKILLEKRKRTQTYQSLDYLLSFITYFDFFSFDAFKITKHSKCLAQSLGYQKVNSDFLLLPFLELDSELTSLLEDSNLTRSNIKKTLFLKNQNPPLSIGEKILNKLPRFVESYFLPKILPDPSISFSHEVNLLFEKAAENALMRFKTPIISADILFITLMEEKNSNAGKLILKYLRNPLDWYLIRYKILKRIHSQELVIRNKVVKNEHYFAYLLKTQIPEIEFNRLSENEILDLGILYFRNKLLRKVLKIDLPELIRLEVNKSIKVTNKRKYSS
jgi:hypothetical protein|uniref:ClpN n=1 Tax=Ochromonas sp. CCMP1393 TaxID=420556 RepID=A0A0D3MKL0_9STRA|nr:ClpN [Ochromonas sp. CCMP1393]